MLNLQHVPVSLSGIDRLSPSVILYHSALVLYDVTINALYLLIDMFTYTWQFSPNNHVTEL